MDKNMPKEYVAELLKQLEELKKKKARKERKLQKLKGCSVEDLKKEKDEKVEHASDKRVSDKISVGETSLKNSFLDKNAPEKNISKGKSSSLFNKINYEKSSATHSNSDKELLVNEKCHSSSFANKKVNKNLKNHCNVDIQKSTVFTDKECVNVCDTDKITADDSLKKSNYLNDSVKHDCCISPEKDTSVKCNLDEQKTNYKKLKETDLPLLNDKLNFNTIECSAAFKNAKTEFSEHCLPILNDEMVCSIEKASSSITDKPRTSNVVHDNETSSDIKEKVQQVNINDDLELPSFKDNAKSFVNLNSSENENKLSNDSNKSVASSKEKSSDILDDSLNSNMSFFMSADLFVHEDNNKKDLSKNHNDNELCEKINESLPIIKNDSKIANSKLPSAAPSHLSMNGHHQNDFNVFNFPKFSTPTEGCTQVEKYDGEPDLIEKSQEIINQNKRNDILNQDLRNSLPSTSKLNSPNLNFVLEKRLSSVLDAHYESPKKNISKTKISSLIDDNPDYFNRDISNGNAYKKRKLFAEVNCTVPTEPKLEEKQLLNSDKESNIALYKSLGTSIEFDEEIRCEDFDNVSAFDSGSNSSAGLKNVSEPLVTFAKNSCDDVPSQVSKTVDGLVNKICNNTSNSMFIIKKSDNKNVEKKFGVDEEQKIDSEILFIPETEGLESYFPKDTEEFLETSTLSQSMEDFPMKENILNVSSQSKLESPVVNNIVAAVKSSRSFRNTHQEDNDVELDVKINDNIPIQKISEEATCDAAVAFDNSLGLDTSFLEDDTQDLGNFKKVPYMNDINIGEKITTDQNKTDEESNLKFMCSLSSSISEPVIDVEVILFSNVKYTVLQHKTYICVWRQEKKKQWVKIFNHQIEDMLSLVKISVSMDDDNLVIIMLLSNEEKYCLQFLIFERDARVIKLMENTHWLEERCSEDSILLCGLSGLMFAIAQNKEKSEISVHAFISLKESPKLMTAVLGSTDTPLCSLCKIDKLPNALMGINDSMLYVWHILEARLVTAVSLHPHNYSPIKECFWATVENGLVYFLTTCVEDKNHHICQLLAANLATGFCQTAMKYSTLPSDNKVQRIMKASYQEPFLVVAHSEGAFIWSVMEEFCCAALPSTSNITSISISRDFDNWGLLAVGSKNGLINCYSLH